MKIDADDVLIRAAGESFGQELLALLYGYAHRKVRPVKYFSYPRDIIHLPVIVGKEPVAVECTYEVVDIVEGRLFQKIEIAGKHDSSIALAGEEISCKDSPLGRFTSRARLLNFKAEWLNKLPHSDRGVIVQIVFDEGVIDQFLGAAIQGRVKLNLKTRAKTISHLYRPSASLSG